ncbi:hypothetical protein JWG44_09920 [Leptospira sp. 201903071]|uniref:LBL_2463 family protein n=1 Tax=Leptospira ainazelensis TaxID=2810034 RepID=UPI0019628C9A|nr:hypothetical protein [Leptospira ainazelensis]MBM9500563.1 hypothetical protein [Leptospira ainazelensis]
MSHIAVEKPKLKRSNHKNQFIEKSIQGVENPIELARVKNFIRFVFTTAGYNKSEYASVNLDPWSTWFYVMDEEGAILSAMRVVEKKPNNFIPLELGVILGSNPPQRYAVIEKKVADWNNVAFINSPKGGRAALQNFQMVAKHCIEQGYEKVYGMYPQRSKAIERIYFSAGAQKSTQFRIPIYFPGDYSNGELVLLNPIEINKTSLQKIAARRS